ncbi:MAG: MFS transporter [Limnobacter sp.]|jgi:predicted MFS family arabinose efflux permease|uniref:MFS transporter n=1 Tax=unclassified Limnobacter TaxID=2630203 RepID=UPI000C3A8400|nr:MULTISPECIES: MFS transporter [unclassified Limnobacter]MAG82029.1 MFS transporter [Sutterellaceae bacterium]PZO12464.1 MAG: MFS transporter [Betaproteobacteria bacterium]MBT84800.1 MFS transporter [Sutterellaceae bacterium]MDP3270838.1 MFS transporter [Limnobacter sp.]PZO24878.1 MAG: MFS transporter [Betaproteobacteria bacterium]
MNSPTACQVTMTPQREWALLLILAGIQFTHILDFMIMMPLGPQLTQAFAISDAKFGLLVSAYTFAAGASGLLASLYIDRFERRRLLLILYVLFAVATLACGLAPTYETLMSARIAAGLFGGILSAMIQTIVADVVPFARRGKAMGVIMTSFSVSTVMGVPLGLYVAANSDWHTPFFGIAGISFVLAVAGWYVIPTLQGHLHARGETGPLQGIAQVLRDSNHLRAFLFSFCMIFAGFSIIPYITIYMQINAGLTPSDIPVIYLAGGAATLFSAQIIGKLSDRIGKLKMLQIIAGVAVLPMALITVTAGLSMTVILVITTFFFVFVSGRMIPGMALVSAAGNPKNRGTFMTLNSSMQSAAMGLAALVGGMVISRNAEGLIENFWICSVIAISFNLTALLIAKRLKVYQ